MQCKCGGETRNTEAVQTKLKTRLAYYVCKDCGTVSSGELFIRDTLVAVDPLARQHFDALNEEMADTLYAEACRTEEEALTATLKAAGAEVTPSRLNDDTPLYATGELF